MIHAIAIEKRWINRSIESKCRLIRDTDYVCKLASLEYLKSNKNIEVSNLESQNLPILYLGSQSDIVKMLATDESIWRNDRRTLLKSGFKTCIICDCDGVVEEVPTLVANKFQYTNAKLRRYTGIHGTLDSIVTFEWVTDELFQSFVDLIRQEEQNEYALNGGNELEKTVAKLNLASGDYSFGIRSKSLMAKSNTETQKQIRNLNVPDGVVILNSIPNVKRVRGCKTLRRVEFNFKFTNMKIKMRDGGSEPWEKSPARGVEKIDLSMCENISSMDHIIDLLNAGKDTLTEVKFPKYLESTSYKLNAIIGESSERQLKLEFGEYISTVSLGAFRFRGNTDNVEVTFDGFDYLDTISDNAFDGFGRNPIDFTKCKNLTYIGHLAFHNCNIEGDLDLSKCSKLRDIGDKAFEGNTILRVKLPNSIRSFKITSFGDYLESINIPLMVSEQAISSLLVDVKEYQLCISAWREVEILIPEALLLCNSKMRDITEKIKQMPQFKVVTIDEKGLKVRQNVN